MADPVYTLQVEVTANSLTDVSAYCNRVAYDRSIARAAVPLAVDNFTAELSDDDGRYTPRRGSTLAPGRQITFSATYGGSSFALFSGKLKSVTPSQRNQRAVVVINASADVDKLQRINLNTNLFINIGVSSLFTEIMTRCGVSSFSTDLIPDTVPYAWYQDRNAANALDQLVEAGNYQLYQDGAGTMRLKNRYWSAAGTDVSSFCDVFDLQYSLSQTNVVNEVKLNTVPRQLLTSAATVAWLETALTIPASGAVGFWMTYQDPINLLNPTPCASLTTLVASTDYMLTQNADGTGSDYTSTASIRLTPFAGTAVCTVFNGTGSAAYLTRFQLKGFSVRALSLLGVQIEDSSSQAVYGKRGRTVDNALIQDYAFMTNLANAYLTDQKNPRDSVTMVSVNDWPNPVAREVGDVINVVNSVTGINSSWAIRAMNHDITVENGVRHQVSYVLEEAGAKDWFSLDDPIRGVLNNTQYLLAF